MVVFNESEHSYKNNTGDRYISATTLVHKYAADFDEDYWSTYKAIERLDINFIKNKKIYLASKTTDYLLTVLPYNITIDSVLGVKRIILGEWKLKNDISKVRGTAIHNAKEHLALSSNNITFETAKHKVQDYKVMFNGKSLSELKDVNYYDCLEDGYYSELLLFNHQYNIAGTSDVVIIKTDDKGIRWVIIDDFKSNAEIKTENRFQKMKYPVQHLEDCNYNHYNLQTSLYGWLLEQMGFKVLHTRITWIDKDGNEIPYKYQYLKTDIENIIQHYTKSIL